MKVIAALLFLISFSASAMPAHLLLIRHGEKPDTGSELSPRGWDRAKALPQLFQRAEFRRLGTPAALLGMSPKKPGGSVRAIQTLKYLSDDLGLRIDDSFRRGDESALVTSLARDPRLDGKFVVVCWEHKDLSEVARSLGVRPVPQYPDDRFDRAWLVTMDGDKVLSFQDLPENLLPGDSDR